MGNAIGTISLRDVVFSIYELTYYEQERWSGTKKERNEGIYGIHLIDCIKGARFEKRGFVRLLPACVVQDN